MECKNPPSALSEEKSKTILLDIGLCDSPQSSSHKGHDFSLEPSHKSLSQPFRRHQFAVFLEAVFYQKEVHHTPTVVQLLSVSCDEISRPAQSETGVRIDNFLNWSVLCHLERVTLWPLADTLIARHLYPEEGGL